MAENTSKKTTTKKAASKRTTPKKDAGLPELPKLPRGVDPVFRITDLLADMKVDEEWVQLDDEGHAVKLRPVVSFTEQIPFIQGQLKQNRNPDQFHEANAVFCVNAVCEEHREAFNRWLRLHSDIPIAFLNKLALEMWEKTAGVPLDELSEDTDSSEE